MSNRIILSWPKPQLSPNARVHWSKKAKAVKAYRQEAYYLSQHLRMFIITAPVKMTITFCPPDKRRRDRDNLIASCKAMMDGIADALLIDDSNFEPTYRMGEVVKGGEVWVEIDG